MTFRWKGQANEMEDEIMQVLPVYQLWRKNSLAPVQLLFLPISKMCQKIIIAGCFGCWILDWQAGRGRGQARASCHCLISVVVLPTILRYYSIFQKEKNLNKNHPNVWS